MDDDSGKARRNLIAVSTVVIVIVFLGVESLSFAGLTVRFGFDSWRVWLVCYLFLAYFIFRYCLDPSFYKNKLENSLGFESDIDEVIVIFLAKTKDSYFSKFFFRKVGVSNSSGPENFYHNGVEYKYYKALSNAENYKYYYFLSDFRQGNPIRVVDCNMPVQISKFSRLILRFYCFVFYGNGFWNFLETMLPFWLGLLAVALSSFRLFSIII